MKTFWIILLLGSRAALVAQDSLTFESDFGGLFTLDSVTVTATKGKYDVDEFIDLLVEDSSYFWGFHHLRFVEHSFSNDFSFFNKKGDTIATYHALMRQKVENNCRWTIPQEEIFSGNFMKSRDRIRYYTSRMHQHIFYSRDTTCEQGHGDYSAPAKGMQKHIQQLKKFMFQPGSSVHIPLIGDRLAIFVPENAKYYDYRIEAAPYKGVEAYRFRTQVKPGFRQHKEQRTIIKDMDTYFRASDFKVLGRTYHLQYFGPLFDFDVHIHVKLQDVGSRTVVSEAQYQGWWKVPTKRKEHCHFLLRFYDFKFKD